MSIVETIPVFGIEHRDVEQTYRFTIGDSYPCEGDPTQICGDGICCNYGNGGYKLYDGAVDNNILLASGGSYGVSESVFVQSNNSQAVA